MVNSESVTITAVFTLPRGCWLAKEDLSIHDSVNCRGIILGHVKVPPDHADLLLNFIVPNPGVLATSGTAAIEDRYSKNSKLQAVLAMSNAQFDEALALALSAEHHGEERTLESTSSG